ncbi:MAG: hypothetical protein C0630_17665 [Sedimenticola selenatireducens]|uniref:UPF0761 membrane protein C0630_17665 n=2 Tax=Sedimenticola selenatireducens TaxID=191960 RepID=A0A2N6CRN8_9GAMM|nr:MAG: hypothetical protein C0630_17665 [Sedimenticola selenatireducens]
MAGRSEMMGQSEKVGAGGILMAWRRVRQFGVLIFSRFIADHGLPTAAALTFTSLLSMVPLMAVSLALLTAFPVGDRVVMQLQNFVFNNFLPSSGEVVQQYLNQFSQKAARMTGPGLVFLIATALLMMANIERAFNRIWRIDKRRRLLSRFMVYWAILTLGPLLIGLSVAVTSYLVSMPLLSDTAQLFGPDSGLLRATPAIASAVAFSLLYLVVPNQPVPLAHAVAGGVLAALLFELAKRIFAYYITLFPAYEMIYGALAVIPLFLVWLYLSWTITLLGAEFCCCLAIMGKRPLSHAGFSADPLLVRFHLMRLLSMAQREGESRSLEALADQLPEAGEEQLSDQLQLLQEANFLFCTDSGGWVLARDLTRVTLLDLYLVQPGQLPDAERLGDSVQPCEQVLAEVLGRAQHALSESLARPLDELFLLDSDDTQQQNI